MDNSKICLYFNARNETRIVELINHYLYLGFDYFIIFDDNSDIPIIDVLSENKIDLTNFTIIKNTFYKNIKDVYSSSHWTSLILPILKEKKIDYLLHIDADEILYMRDFLNIKDLISFYQPFDRIHIDWVIFGQFIKNNHSSSIINSFNKSEEYIKDFNKGIQGKSLVKVSSLDISLDNIKKQVCPHFLNIKHGSIVKDLNNDTFNIKNNLTVKTLDAPLYLAHYSHQDIESYILRKICSDLHIEVYYHKFVNNDVRKELLLNLKAYSSDIIECVYNTDYYKEFKKSKTDLGETFFILVGAAISTYDYVTKSFTIDNSKVSEFHEKIKQNYFLNK